MGHLERKQREKDNIRKRILEAALNIAIEENWQAVTIRRIADAVEYTTSIVYSHFKNKDALLLELADTGFKKLKKQLEKVIETESDPKEQLMQLSVYHWDFASENRELYDLMFNTDQIIKDHDIDKATGRQAKLGKEMLFDLFANITGNKDVEMIGLNWICLRRGSINLLIDIDKQRFNFDPKEAYIEFIQRFITSIAK